MLILSWLFFTSALRYTFTAEVQHSPMNDTLGTADRRAAEIILSTTEDIIKDSNERVAAMYEVKLDNLKSAPFEVGYLMYTIQEKYRKMVDKYNTSHLMDRMLYIMEHVLYLEEIEHHFWEIEHLCNMAHEIERKYKVRGTVFDDAKSQGEINITTPINPYKTKSKKKQKFKWERDARNRLLSTTKKRYRGRFPLDYGWEVEGLP